MLVESRMEQGGAFVHLLVMRWGGCWLGPYPGWMCPYHRMRVAGVQTSATDLSDGLEQVAGH